MKLRNSLLAFLLLCISTGYSQLDSTMLVFSNFMNLVKNNHPLSNTYTYETLQAKARLLESRGAFDPKLAGEFLEKYFDKKSYFQYNQMGVSIPTWFGIELKTEYTNNFGPFISPDFNNPANGLVSAGFKIPLAQNLFIDKRRAELAKAKIKTEQALQQMQLDVNDLLLQAAESYLNWQNDYKKLKICEFAQQLAMERYKATVLENLIGNEPAIDTLEAFIQYQNRQIAYIQAQANAEISKLNTEVFLWHQGLIPLALKPNTYPDTQSISLLFGKYISSDTNLYNHPALIVMQQKLAVQSVDIKLNQELLKPNINLAYLPLIPFQNQSNYSGLLNNYKWQIQADFPIFLRQARGKLKYSKLEYAINQNQNATKQREINQKINNAATNFENTNKQLFIYNSVVLNYNSLLQAEKTKFSIGESSIFMVNTRETNYIQSQLNLIDAQLKNQISYIKLLHSFAALPKVIR